MSGPARRPFLLAVVLALTAMVFLGACGGVIGSFVSTRQALSAAGYSKVSIGVTGGDDDLKVSATVDQNTSPGEIREIAAIVWRDFHQRFGALDITLHAADVTVHQVIPFAELQKEIGPRNPADNRTSIRSGILRTGIAVIVTVVLIVALVVVIVIVLRRRRRLGRPSGDARGPRPGRGIGSQGDAGSGVAADDGTAGDGASWGAPVAAPVPAPAPQDPWEPPPGSAPRPW